MLGELDIAEIWESCPGSFEIRSEIGEDRHSVLYIQYYYGSGFWLEDDLVNLMIDIADFFRQSVEQLRKRINEFDYRLFHYALPPRTFKEADE